MNNNVFNRRSTFVKDVRFLLVEQHESHNHIIYKYIDIFFECISGRAQID